MVRQPALCRDMDDRGDTSAPETFNPWSIVNLVFHHLASEGLHPVLGEAGDPGVPAAELLRTLGIKPAAEGSRQASEQTKRDLEKIRAVFDQRLWPGRGQSRRTELSHVESS